MAGKEDHGEEVGVDWVNGEVIHSGPECPGWHPWDSDVYGEPGI